MFVCMLVGHFLANHLLSEIVFTRCETRMLLGMVLVSCILICGCQQFRSESAVNTLCNKLLPEGYELFKAPDENGQAITVLIGFQVLDIGEIDEEKMDFRLHAFVMSMWNDSRLYLDEYRDSVVTELSIVYERCRRYIWTPDIFFETAKQVENYESTSPSTILKVRSDGAIIMSTRYSFKAACDMNFENYPFDAQECVFFVSLSEHHYKVCSLPNNMATLKFNCKEHRNTGSKAIYTGGSKTNKVTSSDSVAVLKWVGESHYQISSIKMMREAQPLQFVLRKPTVDTVTEVFAEGNYTSLLANFRLVRRLTGSIMNTYAPSTMIVTMSWVSFWIKVDAVPARVALSVTSLLTLCTQVDQYKSQLPPVNYIKAMDIWLFVCILMVFSSLLVFAISYHIHTRKCKECSKQKNVDEKVELLFKKGRKMKLYPLISEEDKQIKFVQSSMSPVPPEAIARHCQKCLEMQAWGPRVDEICRTLFPGSFLLFAVIYWIHYLKIYNNHLL